MWLNRHYRRQEICYFPIWWVAETKKQMPCWTPHSATCKCFTDSMDASLQGSGATLESFCKCNTWQPSLLGQHFNVLEIEVVVPSPQTFVLENKAENPSGANGQCCVKQGKRSQCRARKATCSIIHGILITTQQIWVPMPCHNPRKWTSRFYIPQRQKQSSSRKRNHTLTSSPPHTAQLPSDQNHRCKTLLIATLAQNEKI